MELMKHVSSLALCDPAQILTAPKPSPKACWWMSKLRPVWRWNDRQWLRFHRGYRRHICWKPSLDLRRSIRQDVCRFEEAKILYWSGNTCHVSTAFKRLNYFDEAVRDIRINPVTLQTLFADLCSHIYWWCRSCVGRGCRGAVMFESLGYGGRCERLRGWGGAWDVAIAYLILSTDGYASKLSNFLIFQTIEV